MNALELLAEANGNLHIGAVGNVLGPLNEEQVRSRPIPGGNSIAWLVWHAARCEDVGVNLFAAGRRQVLDDQGWTKRLKLPIRIYGTGMGDEEVAELSATVDVKALRGYFDAVGERTQEVLGALTPETLDEVVDPVRQEKVLRDEGVLGANAEWVPPMYAGHTKGWFLRHLAVTHSYYHLGAAAEIKTLLGIRARPTDGHGRAAPEWNVKNTLAKGS